MKSFRVVFDWILRIAGAFMIFVLLSSVLDHYLYWDLEPPPTVKDVSTFQEWRPDLDLAQQRTIRGSTFYSVRGPRTSLMELSASEYYFDSNGNYIGRSRDAGNKRNFRIFLDEDLDSSRIAIGEIPRPAQSGRNGD